MSHTWGWVPGTHTTTKIEDATDTDDNTITITTYRPCRETCPLRHDCGATIIYRSDECVTKLIEALNRRMR